MALDPRLKSPKEEPLFLIGAIFSSFVWLFLTVGTLGIGVVYGVFIAAGVLIAHALFLAHVRGNGIRISEQQLPDIHRRCRIAAEKLGMSQLPDVYVLQSGGVLNAFATKLLSRRFVIIHSALLNECTDPRQLDFVIGHELGHLAAGHLAWNFFLSPFRLMPWLGPAYSRAREYTCDRLGFHVVGELEPSLRALVVLAAGGRYSGEVSLPAFMAQREEAGDFWMTTLELVSTHPFLCKRVAALEEMAHPGTVRHVPRNPLAYPLAPFFGVSAGSASSLAILVVAYIGILAAIGIPAFMKFREQMAEKPQSALAPPSSALEAWNDDRGGDNAAEADDDDDDDGDDTACIDTQSPQEPQRL